MGNKAKKRSRSRRGGGGKGGGSDVVWDSTDHAVRKHHQQSKTLRKQQEENPSSTSKSTERQNRAIERREYRTAKLTHDSKDKREQAKLRLNITKTQRQIEQLRTRLSQWDEITERQQLAKEQEEEAKRRQEATQPKKKKRGRLGPETWKLKGAARPAWQVNEMDIRYQCPHQLAHEQAALKAKRIQNLLYIGKGKFGIPQLLLSQNKHKKKNKKKNDSGYDESQQQQNDPIEEDDISYPHRRQFLSLLMQLGLLCMEAKQYKSARQAFLECLELDGIESSISLARCYLMRLYLQVNRPQSVQTLWETKLCPNNNNNETKEKSAWVWYSVALVAYIRWKDFQEIKRVEAEEILVQAIQANIFCAYYLAFADTFHQHMEYVDEIQDIQNYGSLEEAIEYCCSEQMGMWMGTSGALEWIQQTILRIIHQQPLAGDIVVDTSIVDWKSKLIQIEKEYKQQYSQSQQHEGHQDDGGTGQDGHNSNSNDHAAQPAAAHHQNDHDDDDDDNHNTWEEDDDSDSDDDDNEFDQNHVDTLMYAGMFRTVMEMLQENGSLDQVPPAIEEDKKETETEKPKEESDDQSTKSGEQDPSG